MSNHTRDRFVLVAVGRPATAVSASTKRPGRRRCQHGPGQHHHHRLGENHSDTEITTPRPDQVTARRNGSGDELAVDITAPHNWKIHARSGSQVLAGENAATPPIAHGGTARRDAGPIRKGVLWLASASDAFSNKVVGWRTGPRADTGGRGR
ncbi:hypothetical protein RHA1_ro09150 (plasmid) [Rhodococcus jostii RHA1]|uniref:Uncharacterized protein n=1 Tax=Rhodococcus jostii (strain RHA1) TaxID=101510 RepID=Q0RWZ3_RHOJR|nr:hypothetical protein RHA1_ro09150 [Rhodococcus jostii RHA1]